ncbi:hypothetical protein ABW20_dc0104692 [Dactylellina cionopaga]|nr:hypothetical protein ABW20_dc0104692 [Dactylellina cionopaga]
MLPRGDPALAPSPGPADRMPAHPIALGFPLSNGEFVSQVDTPQLPPFADILGASNDVPVPPATAAAFAPLPPPTAATTAATPPLHPAAAVAIAATWKKRMRAKRPPTTTLPA